MVRDQINIVTTNSWHLRLMNELFIQEAIIMLYESLQQVPREKFDNSAGKIYNHKKKLI
jgi:hypothetical protein